MKKKTKSIKHQKPIFDELDELPKECEICWQPFEQLTFNEETKEWICPKCLSDLKNEKRIYEDHFSYSHHYYMDNWDDENDENDENLKTS